MSVRIRLRRVGKPNAPCHRVVVCDKHSPRDGRFIENVGTYDPRHSTETLDLARIDYWLSKGAQPTDTVSAIIKRVRAGITQEAARAAKSAKVAASAAAAAAPEAPKAAKAE